MISLAFKNGLADPENTPLEIFFTEAILKHTGGKFSHVELWLDGLITKARCFSSREPDGTSFQYLDLSNSAIWIIVELPFTLGYEEEVEWFCMGSAGRAYDMLGIVGIGTDTGYHDVHDRFCSEAMVDIIQSVFNLLKAYFRWTVAPSGDPKGGYGLYELVTEILLK